MTTRRYELTDLSWAIISPLLPNKPRGMPHADNRKVSNGIYWRLRTGCLCADIPARYGPYTTCYNRFARWRKIGVRDKIFDAVSKAYDGDLSGKIHALVEERHRSREFIAFLRRLDEAYPKEAAIKLILDNHSAHISKETNAWVAAQRPGRFDFVFTPKHGPWLNLIEGFFSKLARSVLRQIRVKSKQRLKQRILAAIDDFNQNPVVHIWTYKLNNAA